MSDPTHIISLGAGVQSSTALMAACGEITPMPVAAVFADTQAEPKSVYTWLDWLGVAASRTQFAALRAEISELEKRQDELSLEERSTLRKKRADLKAVQARQARGEFS